MNVHILCAREGSKHITLTVSFSEAGAAIISYLQTRKLRNRYTVTVPFHCLLWRDTQDSWALSGHHRKSKVQVGISMNLPKRAASQARGSESQNHGGRLCRRQVEGGCGKGHTQPIPMPGAGEGLQGFPKNPQERGAFGSWPKERIVNQERLSLGF